MKRIIVAILSVCIFIFLSGTHVLSEPVYDLQCAVDKFNKNPKDCYKIFNKLYTQSKSPEAAYNLAICYLHGLGITQDDNKAFNLMKRSATEGFTDAENTLGGYYELGVGTKKNNINAFKCYSSAAEKGNLDAQYATGRCYQYSIGTKESLPKAIFWYQKAAESGHVWAQESLGLCYRYGRGVEPDEEKARFWYQKAADQGYEPAQKALEDMGYSKKNMLIF